eukprot:scaffold583_cov279-Chaetoceros_neogracile.AAC.21
MENNEHDEFIGNSDVLEQDNFTVELAVKLNLLSTYQGVHLDRSGRRILIQYISVHDFIVK